MQEVVGVHVLALTPQRIGSLVPDTTVMMLRLGNTAEASVVLLATVVILRVFKSPLMRRN